MRVIGTCSTIERVQGLAGRTETTSSFVVLPDVGPADKASEDRFWFIIPREGYIANSQLRGVNQGLKELSATRGELIL